MSSLAIVSLILVFVVRECSHYIQDARRDKLISELTDKIKARDFTEYREAIAPTPVYEPVSKTDEELYWDEIEQNKQ